MFFFQDINKLFNNTKSLFHNIGPSRSRPNGTSNSEAVHTLKDSMTQMDKSMIVATLLATNQFDTIRDAASKPSSLILMPYTAEGAVGDITRVAAAIRTFSQDKEKL